MKQNGGANIFFRHSKLFGALYLRGGGGGGVFPKLTNFMFALFYTFQLFCFSATNMNEKRKQIFHQFYIYYKYIHCETKGRGPWAVGRGKKSRPQHKFFVII